MGMTLELVNIRNKWPHKKPLVFLENLSELRQMLCKKPQCCLFLKGAEAIEGKGAKGHVPYN
jgi:hypothetical protein